MNSLPTVAKAAPEDKAGGVISCLRGVASRPWFAYLMLFLLQMKVIWGMWQYQDLTFGDTSAYFRNAANWCHHGTVNIAWSPLYTAFFGTVLSFWSDPYLTVTTHRILIVLAASLMVLAVMRRLLPEGLAWLVAAWWVVLPINFNTLYEVHLFAVLPMLAAWLIVSWKDAPWARGGALAVIGASAILVRNEFSVVFALSALAYLAWDILSARKTGTGFPFRSIAAGYGIPLVAAALVCGLFYSRSIVKYPELKGTFSRKHTVNMAQVYAFGYQQRHPEWSLSPWTESGDLMKRQFGKDLLPLSDMIARNRREVLKHFAWNFRLAPNGLQVLLFNASFGTTNPDYAPVVAGSKRALVLGILVLCVLMAGLTIFLRNRRPWWDYWLDQRILVWLSMAAAAGVTPLIIATQRPRPSYLFTLSLFIMALVGMSVFMIASRWPGLRRLSALTPLVMIGMVAFVKPYYADETRRSPQPLRRLVERLKPFHAVLGRSGANALIGDYAYEAAAYVGEGKCRSYNYSLLKERPAGMSFEEFFEKRGLHLVYINDRIYRETQHDPSPEARRFFAHPEGTNWELIARQELVGDCYLLLLRRP